jgi:hypothetical protein
LERLTRTGETATRPPEAEVGKDVTRSQTDGKILPCSSPADSHCLGRKTNGCCGDGGSSKRNVRESISGSSASGKNGRKDCASSCSREAAKGGRDGEYVSGAADLACVLLFGHTVKELLQDEDSPGDR